MSISSEPDQIALAMRLALEDPARAVQLASDLLERAVEAGSPADESRARRVLGVAARTRGDIVAALTELERAVEVAEAAGESEPAGEARMSLAAALAFAGEDERALQTLDGATASGPTAIALAAQRTGMLTMMGRYEEALAAYQPVVPALRRGPDRVREARALNNRGLVYLQTGRLAEAEADLARAERLQQEAGNATEAARYRHNRGVVATRRGDLATALRLLEEADQRCATVGAEVALRAVGRAETLLAAGLLREAQATVTDAVGELRTLGNLSEAAQALVLLSDIALLAGDLAGSLHAAEQAAELSAGQQRSGWHARSQAAAARAAEASGERDPAKALLATESAMRLGELGLVDEATMAHAVAGRLWLAAGELEAGLSELQRSAGARHRGTAARRLAGWQAESSRRLALGDRRGSMSALVRALSVVEEQRSSIQATELRASIAVHAQEAATAGLRLAISTRRAPCILQWMERHRANSLRVVPARPPRDEVLAAQLSELRVVTTEIASCATTGREPSGLLARQAELERQVRERAWHVARTGEGHRRERAIALGAISASLRDAALVELAEVDGWLHAVVLSGGRCAHRRLAPAGEVGQEAAHLRLAMRRLAYGEAGALLGAGAAEHLGRSSARLDRLVIAPLLGKLGSRPLVLVPTGELHAVPWGALPSLAERPVTVAPSAALWLKAIDGEQATVQSSAPRLRTSGSGSGGVLIVAGPGLSGARQEAELLGKHYPEADVLTGRRAGSRQVLRRLEGARLAHVAAHATFRSDNAQWSSLRLADGPLTVYDLEQLRRPPELVVLSACQSGLSAVHPGDEMMGLVAALLALGTRSVVASVLPVEDSASVSLMLAFHERLASGDGPAAALAEARSRTGGSIGAAFSCFGAG